MTKSHRSLQSNILSKITHESIGNLKKINDNIIPSDKLGNIKEEDKINLTDDHLGNSLNDEPCHLKSGILGMLSKETSPKKYLVKNNLPEDELIKNTKADFLNLIALRQGIPFTFSIRAYAKKGNINSDIFNKKLLAMKKLILAILANSPYESNIEISKYQSSNHEFVVFFIAPKSSDTMLQKDLIAALREALEALFNKHINSFLNAYLVLANAKAVVDEHLLKLGAKKIL